MREQRRGERWQVQARNGSDLRPVQPMFSRGSCLTLHWHRGAEDDGRHQVDQDREEQLVVVLLAAMVLEDRRQLVVVEQALHDQLSHQRQGLASGETLDHLADEGSGGGHPPRVARGGRAKRPARRAPREGQTAWLWAIRSGFADDLGRGPSNVS